MKSPPGAPSGAPGWKGVALSALAGGIAGGLNANTLLFNLTSSPAVNTALRMATANALTQGIGVATGLQKKFDWKGVAASAAGGFAGAAVGARLPEGLDPFLGKIVTGFAAGTAAAVARGGRVAIQQVAVDAFGSAIGSSLGNALGSSLASASSGAPTTQGVGPWSDRDYVNGMDLQSDQAYEARRAQEWIEQSDRIQSRRLYEVTVANAQDNFGATERQYRLETETSVAGSGYVARSGDSISRILGSSSPQAIGNFMRANGLTSDRIEAGRNYFRPASVTTYGDSAALGQFALNQSNERIAAQRAAAALARNTSVTGDITLGDLDVLNAAFDRRDQAIASLRNFVGPLQPVTGFGEIKASPEIGLGKQLAGAVFGEPLAFVRKLAGDLPVNPITNRLENFDGADRTLLAAMGIAPLPFAKAAQGARVGEQLTTAALRSEAAASIREARNLLKDAGVPLLARNEIIRSFELESFRVQRLTSEQTALRVFDDSNATLVGRYVSPDFFGNQTDRITNFALMKNSATRLGEVTMPQGSVVFTGRVAPQLSYSPGLTGGANQIFLTGPLSNYQFREVMLPR